MSKLSIDPSFIVLNLQSKTDLPTSAPFEKPQSGLKESSFSKALDAAKKLKSFEPKEKVSQSKSDSMNRPEKSAYQNNQTDNNSPRSATKAANDDTKKQASVDDNQSSQNDDQTPVAQGQAGTDAAPNQKDVGSEEDKQDPKNSTQAVDSFIMQVLANIQPVMVDNDPQDASEPMLDQLINSDTAVTQPDSISNTVNLTAVQNQSAPVDEKNKSGLDNESQKLLQGLPVQVNPQVETPIPVDVNLKAVQSQENLINVQTVMSQNQKEPASKPVTATATQTGVEFAGVLIANDAKNEAASKTSDPVIKSDEPTAVKVEAHKTTEKVAPLKSFEDTPIELKTKRTDNTEIQTITQTDGKDAKPVAINLPVIQTQLSVKGQMDKARLETPLISSVQTQPATTDTSVTNTGSTANVNKTEVFSQIIERAKIMVNNGNSEMEVSLKPEHLGKLQLKVSVENQIVTAKFVAESQQVKEIIETNLSQLRQNLHDTGIQVDQLMVSVGQQGGGNFQDATNFQNGFTQNNSSSSFSSRNTEELETNDSIPNARQPETLIDLIA